MTRSSQRSIGSTGSLILTVLLLLLLIVLRSLPYAVLLDYTATNGDWQNFNPVRRLDLGQRMGQDFDVFLGWGVTWLIAWLASFGGADFASVRLAAYLTSGISFVTVLAGLMYLMRVPLRVAISLGALAYALASISNISALVPDGPFKSPLLGIIGNIGPKNSLQILRPAVPVIAALVYLTLHRWKLRDRSPLRRLTYCGALSMLAGCCAITVGDYGLPTAALLCALTAIPESFWARSWRWSDLIRSGVDTIVVAFITILWIVLLTGIAAGTYRGIALWWEYSRAISENSFWYFEGPASKLLAWNSFISNPAVTVGIILGFSTAVFWTFRAISKRNIDEFLAAAVVGLFATVALLLGYLGSLSQRYVIPSMLAILASCLALSFPFILAKINQFSAANFNIAIRWFTPLILTVAASHAGWNFKDFKASIQRLNTDTLSSSSFENLEPIKSISTLNTLAYVPVPEMGGYLSATFARDVISARAESASSGPILSTYSGLFELLRGDLNPTRYDYIIHALGVKRMEEYLHTVQQLKPARVNTINPEYFIFEKWVRTQHWSLYRYLIENYEPWDRTPTWILWRKRAQLARIQDPLQVCAVEKSPDGAVKITLPANPKLTSNSEELWFAEIVVDYEAPRQSLRRSYVFCSEDPVRFSTGLPYGNQQRILPAGGNPNRGAELTISVVPRDPAFLKVHSAQGRWICPVAKIDAVPLTRFLPALHFDRNWNNGILTSGVAAAVMTDPQEDLRNLRVGKQLRFAASGVRTITEIRGNILFLNGLPLNPKEDGYPQFVTVEGGDYSEVMAVSGNR